MTDFQPSCNSPCTTQTAAPETYDLHTDVLWGARNISKFLYGSEEYYRKVYSLVATSRIPIIHLGGRLCARKTALMAYITGLENQQLLLRPDRRPPINLFSPPTPPKGL